MSKVDPVPAGYHTITPHLTIDGCAEAIDFYVKAFGAEERYRMPDPAGRIMHAEIQIGDSIVMMADSAPERGNKDPKMLGGASGGLMMYTPDVDAAFKRAVDAGCTVEMEPADMFWGDRFCAVKDPFGHSWSLATHIEDPSEEEMQRRMSEQMPS